MLTSGYNGSYVVRNVIIIVAISLAGYFLMLNVFVKHDFEKGKLDLYFKINCNSIIALKSRISKCTHMYVCAYVRTYIHVNDRSTFFPNMNEFYR